MKSLQIAIDEPVGSGKSTVAKEISRRLKAGRLGRRFQEYEARGNNVPHSEIVRALKERDELDMRRAYAPLRKAEDTGGSGDDH